MTEQQLSQVEAVNGSAEPTDVWRNELQDRLARYKRRRGRRIEGAFTMRFPFPADDLEALEPQGASPVEVVAVEADALTTDPEVESASGPVAIAAEAPHDELVNAGKTEITLALEAAVEPGPAAPDMDFALQAPQVNEDDNAVFVDSMPRARPKRKVIAFPRQATVPPEVVHHLAEPVTAEVPRILDVPEELEAIPATPFLDGLQLDVPDPVAEAQRRDHVDLPFQAVRVSQRVMAGMADLAVTGAGIGIFAAVAYKVLDNPQMTKPLFLGLVAGAAVLWAAYQYLFIVHAGKTLGMMAVRVRIATFKGKAPTMRQRRHRVLGLFLSSLSLAMGLMWAFVDVDGLCWHDRLSHTYLANRG